MTETHKSFGLFRVPEVLDFLLMGVPGKQCAFSFQSPRRPMLFDTRSRLNIKRYAFSIVTTGTGGNDERSRHYWRRVFPQPVHSLWAAW